MGIDPVLVTVIAEMHEPAADDWMSEHVTVTDFPSEETTAVPPAGTSRRGRSWWPTHCR